VEAAIRKGGAYGKPLTPKSARSRDGGAAANGSKPTYRELSLKMICKTRRISILTLGTSLSLVAWDFATGIDISKRYGVREDRLRTPVKFRMRRSPTGAPRDTSQKGRTWKPDPTSTWRSGCHLKY
jgi:hypothetical protein